MIGIFQAQFVQPKPQKKTELKKLASPLEGNKMQNTMGGKGTPPLGYETVNF